MSLPVLYSFRRCPYAMRARLALQASGVAVHLREVALRNKPGALLAASPKGTVPVLVTGDQVIEESRDIMLWALGQHDPQGLLADLPASEALIDQNDGPFKSALDAYKYPGRQPGADPDAAFASAVEILTAWEAGAGEGGLVGDAPQLADLALAPFVRQFAKVDMARFEALPLPRIQRWLAAFLASSALARIMIRPAPWQDGDAPLRFPVAA